MRAELRSMWIAPVAGDRLAASCCVVRIRRRCGGRAHPAAVVAVAGADGVAGSAAAARRGAAATARSSPSWAACAPHLGVLRNLRPRRGPLAAAGQHPGAPDPGGRAAHLADQHRPVAAGQPGRLGFRLPQPAAAARAHRSDASHTLERWSATAAISTTGTTPQTLQPLPPHYVSTVDSGNLAGHLLTLRQGLLALLDATGAGARHRSTAWPTRCGVLEETVDAGAASARWTRRSRHSGATARAAAHAAAGFAAACAERTGTAGRRMRDRHALGVATPAC